MCTTYFLWKRFPGKNMLKGEMYRENKGVNRQSRLM